MDIFDSILAEFNANKNNATEEELEALHNSAEFQELKAEEIVSETSNEANMQGKTVQEIMGLTNRNSTIVYSHNALEHYDIDLEIYEDIVDQSPVMQETLEEGEQLLPTFKYLHQDIFLSLYKYKAKIIPNEQLHMSVRMNRNILNTLLNTPEYIQLRQVCRLDQFNAALGTEIIGREAIEILKNAVQKIKDFQQQKQALDDLVKKEEEMDDIIQEMQDIDDLIEQAKQQGNTQYAAQLQAENNQNAMSVQQAKQLAGQIAQNCNTLIEDDDIVGNITKVMGSTLTQASQQVGEVSTLCNAWGLGDGNTCNVTYHTKKEAIEKIRRSKKLTKLTDLVGKFKESAITEQKKKSKNGAVEIKSVTTGNHIQDALPSDRMNLCNETTKRDFYRRYSEHGLLEYSKESNKQKNKGPIIVCVDTSGSMEGDREMWSKALTVGVIEVAQMQKRDFACILYSNRAKDPIVIKKGEVAPEKILRCAEEFDNGGTNFEAPLRKAIELIKESTFKNADILFLTDGDCSVSENFKREFKRTKEDKDFRTIGVLIDAGGRSCRTTLDEFCDSITYISDVADLGNSESDANKTIFGTL